MAQVTDASSLHRAEQLLQQAGNVATLKAGTESKRVVKELDLLKNLLNDVRLHGDAEGAAPLKNAVLRTTLELVRVLHLAALNERGSEDAADTRAVDDRPKELPKEIWHDIFSWLSVPDLLRSSMVCKDWRLMTEDEGLWKALGPPGNALPATSASGEPVPGKTWRTKAIRKSQIDANWGNFNPTISTINVPAAYAPWWRIQEGLLAAPSQTSEGECVVLDLRDPSKIRSVLQVKGRELTRDWTGVVGRHPVSGRPLLFRGVTDKSIAIFDVETGKQIAQIPDPESKYDRDQRQGFFSSPNGRWFVCKHLVSVKEEYALESSYVSACGTPYTSPFGGTIRTRIRDVSTTIELWDVVHLLDGAAKAPARTFPAENCVMSPSSVLVVEREDQRMQTVHCKDDGTLVEGITFPRPEWSRTSATSANDRFIAVSAYSASLNYVHVINYHTGKAEASFDVGRSMPAIAWRGEFLLILQDFLGSQYEESSLTGYRSLGRQDQVQFIDPTNWRTYATFSLAGPNGTLYSGPPQPEEGDNRDDCSFRNWLPWITVYQDRAFIFSNIAGERAERPSVWVLDLGEWGRTCHTKFN